MKVLIIRFSSIGDIVLTTPVIRALKMQKNATIHYLTKKSYSSILSQNPYIDQCWYLENNLKALLTSLKEEKFDVIIDLHHNLRTLRIKQQLKVTSYSFDKLNWQKWLYVQLKINRMPNMHIVDRYMATVHPLGVETDGLGLDYFIPDKDKVSLERLPETHRGEYVIYAIGGQHTTKKLPIRKMIELCDRINKPIVLIGGPEDESTGDEIAYFFEKNISSAPFEDGLLKLNKKSVIFNGCGKFNLNQSASLIKQSAYVFTHDTGMMHVAAAFKKQVFSIWGNTVPGFGMYPYKTKFTVFENNQLSCRPCSKIGYDKCPKKHFKCMEEIKFDFYLP